MKYVTFFRILMVSLFFVLIWVGGFAQTNNNLPKKKDKLISHWSDRISQKSPLTKEERKKHIKELIRQDKEKKQERLKLLKQDLNVKRQKKNLQSSLACPTDPYEPNNTRAQAKPIAYGQSRNGAYICPANEWDYFRFDAQEGDVIIADIDAYQFGSELDPMLGLYDSRGEELELVDDYHDLDPMIIFEIPENGRYYLGVTDFGTSGGENSWYNLKLDLFQLGEIHGMKFDDKNGNGIRDFFFTNVVFQDSMEDGIGGWTTQLIGNAVDDLWHLTDYDANSPDHSWWCGIEEQGDYQTENPIRNALISPLVDLTSATAPVVIQFAEKYETEEGYDFCMVDISTNNGATWIPLRGGYLSAPSGYSDDWIISSYDISDFIGHQIKVRFYFDTGNSYYNDYPGWFIDDVRIGSVNYIEPGIEGWTIWIYNDETGEEYEAVTDIDGNYKFTDLILGYYGIYEEWRSGWVPTYPMYGEWYFYLNNGETRKNIDFGNWLAPPSAIHGMKFHDLNGNGRKDEIEPGLAGWTINAYQWLGNQTLTTVTDEQGRYSFFDLPADFYSITEELQPNWVQTYPDWGYWFYYLVVDTIRDADFGNKLRSGRICVSKYFDKNHNQEYDFGEPPMGNVLFILEGDNQTRYEARTNSSGQVCFENLPLASYVLREVVSAGYAISFPKSGEMNFFIQGGEDTLVVWLNGSAYDTVMFRTFTDSAFAFAKDEKDKVGKAVKCKPYAVDFKFNITAPEEATAVQIKLSMVATGKVWKGKDKQTQEKEFKDTKLIEIKRTIAQGEIFQIDGHGVKGKEIKANVVWTKKADGKRITEKFDEPSKFKLNDVRLRMPNEVNLGEVLVPKDKRAPLVVGNEEAKAVKMLTFGDVFKSLNKKDVTHKGGKPDCLKMRKSPVKTYPPDKIKNELFAAQVALKLNVLASDVGKTAAGLGDLIWDASKVGGYEPTFNGKTVRQIMAQVDSLLACLPDDTTGGSRYVKGLPFDTALVKVLPIVKRINSAFAGAVDTISWSCDNLVFKGIRKLKDVPELRANPNPSRTVPIVSAEKYYIPEMYTLQQNYPNPFNPQTTIGFTLAYPSLVTLKVYNILGQEVGTLLYREEYEDGEHEIEFNANGLPSGIYFYRIIAEPIADEDGEMPTHTFISVKKMMLIR